MTDQPSIDVIVIGAGPTGLTLACDLSRRGFAVRIVEQDPMPNPATRAKTIQPRSLEVLDDLGAVDHVLRHGVAKLPMRFHEPSGAVVDKPPIAISADDSVHTPYPDPLQIGQFHVEHALRQRLEELGGAVEFGTEVIGIEQDDHGVTVALRTTGGEQAARARYVVGADGGKSRTRKYAGLSLAGKTYDEQRWYIGDVTVGSDLDRGHMHLWPSDQGMLGLTPLGDELWQFQSPILPGEAPGVPSLEFYQRLFDERTGTGNVVLTGASWLSVYIVNVRMVDTFRNGRVLLAGDAAHVHSAAGGQGMNTGIQDAYNLGFKLDSILNGALSTLLDTYSEERIPVARRVLAMSTDKMAKAVAAAGGGEKELGSALAGIGDGKMNTGLGIHYRDSRMTYPGGSEATSGPQPGDRAPNVTGLEGEQFRGGLFDLLRGIHYSLFVWDHTAPVIFDNAKPTHMHVHRIGPGGGSPIVDVRGEFRRVYQPYAGELILVRPDGYLLARIPAGQEMDLINHLAPFRSIGNTVRPY
ncbi:FAD-dependent oxidoreductase [Actinoplanes sp. NBRC 103695]|uniref:FAD-dependent oxidoreductase n=1 Tax=Actinoplanes sp. NBRC 103695 TaxID=3032202 RepID=UPI0024A4F26C|nr:FAD-dependent oxidoreductase [Actinoplanes sp. NBRC 103695]GLY98350.1 3-(3-hydroxyphenyl)propionate hydroxylase [Actinoplanes sp. NBRC 103695]